MFRLLGNLPSKLIHLSTWIACNSCCGCASVFCSVHAGEVGQTGASGLRYFIFFQRHTGGRTPTPRQTNGHQGNAGADPGLLGGSWLDISRVISRVTIVITYIRGLITPPITTHEPPSSRTDQACCQIACSSYSVHIRAFQTTSTIPKAEY